MYPTTPDSRAEAILDWLNKKLCLEIQSFAPASNDASFRRYFRVVHSSGQHVVMDAPPDKENTEPFIRIAGILSQSGIHVPAIYQQNLIDGFLLLEDFGSVCFLDRLNADTADTLYQTAFDSLFKLQTQTTVGQTELPEYDAPLLQRELDIFYQWFLGHLLDIEIPETEKQALDDLLIHSALSQPRVCVHRDFHSRNLMIVGQNSPGVIDFQDAVIGPISYDLVSLLRDCYISWPQIQVEQWMAFFYRRIANVGLVDADLDTFRQWFDLMGLQRHLKAIGIFVRLHLRDNKSGYLGDIPRTLNYVTQICDRYTELSDFRSFLQNKVLPLYRKKL